MLLFKSISAWIRRFFACMGSCLGCCTKRAPVIAECRPNVGEPTNITAGEQSNGLTLQGRTVKEPSMSEDFWDTSPCEMDSSAVESQRSVSSFGTSNLTRDPHSGSGSSNRSEFVNHGLLLWNQTRQQWIGNKKEYRKQEAREPKISWNATYDSLLGTSKPFPRPIPLPEMVDFLVDTWEHEGMYD